MLRVWRSSVLFVFLMLTAFMTVVFLFSNQAVHRQSNTRFSMSKDKYFDLKDKLYQNLTTEAAEIQRQRRSRVHRVCRKIMKLQPIDILNDQLRFSDADERVWLRLTYFVDDQKLAFFLVLKAGFSNWLDFITSILTEGTAKLRVSRGVPFTLDDIRPKLKSYKKIMFVRNPISRLVSGYVDKFVDLPTEFYTNMSRDIIGEVRGEAFPRNKRPDLTFPEFLRFILTTKKHMDGHWKPIHEQKIPCDIDYDFIGKLETVSRDVDYLKLLYNVDKNAVYQKSYITNEKRISLMLNYYRHLPAETIENIIQKYKYDFLLFGYPLPNASNILEYIRTVKPDDFYIPSD